MRDEPKDISTANLAASLHAGWNVAPDSLTYAPVGFGSYHWIAVQGGRKWFVTADRLDGDATFANLRDAYVSAALLRDSGLDFVVAPLPDAGGRLLRRIDAWALALFPYLEGTAAGDGLWTDLESASRIAGLLGRLHASKPPETLPRFDFALPHRDRLFDRLDEPWNSGPYGERARLGLKQVRGDVEALLAYYDQLVAEIEADPTPWVVSHGEPHSANVLDVSGEYHLIDWDTVRLAPAERDLAGIFLDEEGSQPAGRGTFAAAHLPQEAVEVYLRAGGPATPRPAALRLFRLWWDVSEICGYVNRFRSSHEGTLDDEVSWRDLERYLQVERNWPDIRVG